MAADDMSAKILKLSKAYYVSAKMNVRTSGGTQRPFVFAIFFFPRYLLVAMDSLAATVSMHLNAY